MPQEVTGPQPEPEKSIWPKRSNRTARVRHPHVCKTPFTRIPWRRGNLNTQRSERVCRKRREVYFSAVLTLPGMASAGRSPIAY